MRPVCCWILLSAWGCATESFEPPGDAAGGAAAGASPQPASTGAAPALGGAVQQSGGVASTAAGGAAGTDGAGAPGGGAPASSLGGESPAGGGSGGTVAATGGEPGTGGASLGGSSSGGSSSTGGAGDGGASSSGGEPPTGGASAAGAAANDGGAGEGGVTASGGDSSRGGVVALGGASPQGGATVTAAPLDGYVRTLGPLELAGIANASGITWKPETDTFFVVTNGSHTLYEYTADLSTRLRDISLDGGPTDTEDVAYLGADRFAVVDEGNEVFVVKIPAGATSADLSAGDAERYRVSAPPAPVNRGLEGVAWRPDVGPRGQLVVCQEGGVTGVPIRVLFFQRGASAGSYDHADGSLLVDEPWDALAMLGGVVTDLAGACYDASSSTLLLLSQESSRLLRVAPETGELLDQRDLAGSPQYEGVTLADEGRLVVVSEPNLVEIYQSR